jgi:hypothetical protein
VPKEPSDFKEALLSVGVWRSATTMSGAQCVMTFGALLMPMWSAGSWDLLKTQVLRYIDSRGLNYYAGR